LSGWAVVLALLAAEALAALVLVILGVGIFARVHVASQTPIDLRPAAPLPESFFGERPSTAAPVSVGAERPGATGPQPPTMGAVVAPAGAETAPPAAAYAPVTNPPAIGAEPAVATGGSQRGEALEPTLTKSPVIDNPVATEGPSPPVSPTSLSQGAAPKTEADVPPGQETGLEAIRPALPARARDETPKTEPAAAANAGIVETGEPPAPAQAAAPEPASAPARADGPQPPEPTPAPATANTADVSSMPGAAESPTGSVRAEPSAAPATALAHAEPPSAAGEPSAKSNHAATAIRPVKHRKASKPKPRVQTAAKQVRPRQPPAPTPPQPFPLTNNNGFFPFRTYTPGESSAP
jgi:hypothetical protein